MFDLTSRIKVPGFPVLWISVMTTVSISHINIDSNVNHKKKFIPQNVTKEYRTYYALDEHSVKHHKVSKPQYNNVTEIIFNHKNGNSKDLTEAGKTFDLIVVVANGTKYEARVMRKKSIIKKSVLHYEENCQFEGFFYDDPDSVISITGCDGSNDTEADGFIITMVTQKLKLSHHSFRVYKGRVYAPSIYQFKDKSIIAPINKENAGTINEEREEEDQNTTDKAENVPMKKIKTKKLTLRDIKNIQNRTSHSLDDILEEKKELHNHYLYNSTGLPGFGDPKSQKKTKSIYKDKTIEIMIVTDPHLYKNVKKRFQLYTDETITQKIYKTILDLVVSAETFLKHKSISSSGGFSIMLSGFKVYKDWEDLGKMKRRKKLERVLYDFADFIQVINHKWDGNHSSYDMAIMFTGNYDFKDGDGFAYIGGVCKLACPVVLKLQYEDEDVNLNMGRLLAHEMAHSLGSVHDGEEFEGEKSECKSGGHLMSLEVESYMDEWSKCTRKLIDDTIKNRTEENCFFT